MRACLHLTAHGLKARWRAWVFFVLVAGFAGGAVLTAAAGARRTDSAYPRFLAASRASDVIVSPAGTGLHGYYQAISRLPGVAAVAPMVGLAAVVAGQQPGAGALIDAPMDGRMGHLLDRPKMLAGRLPRADAPGEVVIDQRGAAMMRVIVGSNLELEAYPINAPRGGAVPPRPRRLTERVVGIAVTRTSVDPVTDLDKAPSIVASPALWHELGPAYATFDGAVVKLRPPATPAGVGRAAQSLARRFPGTGGQVFVADESSQAATVERSIRPEGLALALFAAFLAATALLVVGQIAVRVVGAYEPDVPTLAGLGMTRGQLMAAGLIELGVAAAGAAGAAVTVAIAASPLMPIGAARLAEPSPGVSADSLVLGVGAVAIVVLLVARGAWPVWRIASAARAGAAPASGRPASLAIAGSARGPAVSASLAAALPLTMLIGVRLALRPGRGRVAVPIRSALAGVAVAVLTVTAAFTFGANLLHLVRTPQLYGQTWDAAIDLQFDALTPAQAAHLLARDRQVVGWTFAEHGIVGIRGRVIPAIGVSAGRGPLLSPTLLQGHPPVGDHQIVLGTSTLRQAGLRVGQLVAVNVGGRTMVDRIVGRAVFPNFGQGSFTPTDLGLGAETSAAALTPRAAAGGQKGFEVVLVRFAPSRDRAAERATFQRSLANFCRGVEQSTCVVTNQRPNGASDYARVDGTPEVLAILLSLIGVAVLIQAMVISGRRRQREFAVLKALGLLRRQIVAIASWQATTLGALALLAGVPLGVAAGRWGWSLFATSLGIPANPVTPVALVLIMAPAVVLAANASGCGPGLATARLSPAQALRTE